MIPSLPKYPAVQAIPDKYDKIVVVGDVHGHHKKYVELSGKVIYQGTRISDEIGWVFLGDYVDRGPHSWMVVECLMGAPDTYCCLGNHEERHVRYGIYQQSGKPNPMKVSEDFLEVHETLTTEQLEWMAGLPAAYSWRDYLFLHAGIMPGLGLHFPLKGFLRNRYVTINKETSKYQPSRTWQDANGIWQHASNAILWSDVYKGTIPGYKHDGPVTVVYGHQPMPEPKIEEFSIGLDTGCGEGRKLTAMVINCETLEKEFFSV